MKNFLFATLILTVPALSLAKDLQVNHEKSTISWTGKKLTGEHHGEISIKSSKTSGSLEKLAGEIEVDMKSITVSDLEGEWKEKFLNHIKSEDFFNVDKFPVAKLKITNLSKGEAVGELTIKNKTHPVKFKVTRIENSFEGKLIFDRTQYDMIYGSGSFFKNLGDKAINNEVELTFKIVLE